MTAEEALKSIIEDGIELGGGDYVPLETLKVAKEALEKQIPKKPVDYEECGVTRYKTGRCSCCGEFVIQHYKHCPECGQAIDWSE